MLGNIILFIWNWACLTSFIWKNESKGFLSQLIHVVANICIIFFGFNEIVPVHLIAIKNSNR